MKTYKTPTLAPKGDVVTTTQGTFMAKTDPGELNSQSPVGSVGFGL
jgi:hypothetical protein